MGGKILKSLLVSSIVALSVIKCSSSHAFVTTSRTSDYTVGFSDLTFSDASARYALSFAYPAQPAFDSTFNLQTLSNFNGLTPQQSGGITLDPVPPGPNPVVTFHSNGTLGSWGVTYNSAATNSGPLLALDKSAGLSTLNFNGGGSVSGDGYNDIQYYIYVHVPGNFTTVGTGTGDYQYNRIGPGFSTPTFTFDPVTDMTTVFAFNPDYSGGTATNLNFTLFGSQVAPVPEPATWAMMILGFCGIGFLLYRRKERATLNAT